LIFDVLQASKVDTSATTIPKIGNVSRLEVHLKSICEAVAAAYLRAAHAYMLISMPTGTSTILGVFQAILALLVVNRTKFVLTGR
jgi:hypothetical protein